MYLLWSVALAGSVHSEGCQLRVTPAPRLHDMSAAEEHECLHYGNDIGNKDLHLVVELLPRGEGVARSLATFATDYAFASAAGDAGTVSVSEVQHTTLGGHEAAWVTTSSSLGGHGVSGRVAAVDGPYGIVFMHVFGWSTTWRGQLREVDAMWNSLRLDPGEGHPPWRDQPVPEPVELPLLEARAAAALSFGERTSTGVVASARGAPWFDDVRYEADGLSLRAYATPDPGDGQRRPAVVWVESGFGGPQLAWSQGSLRFDPSAMAFVDAGLAVFAPAFRAELDNPGSAEFFYGETLDLLAAVEHVRGLPWVDPDQVYLVGEGSGALHVLLAAVAGAPVRATFSLGAITTLEEGILDQLPTLTFDRSDPEHLRLRSPVHFAHHLTRPVVFLAGEEMDQRHAYAFQAAAADGLVEVHPIPGSDYQAASVPAKQVVVQSIQRVAAGARRLGITSEGVYEAAKARDEAVAAHWVPRDAEQLGDKVWGWCRAGSVQPVVFSGADCVPCERLRREGVEGALAGAWEAGPPLVVDVAGGEASARLIQRFEVSQLPTGVWLQSRKCGAPLTKGRVVRREVMPEELGGDELAAWWAR